MGKINQNKAEPADAVALSHSKATANLLVKNT